MNATSLAAVVLVACTPAHAAGYTAGDTMIPTFAIGAQLHVDHLARPARGDVIVFQFPGKAGRSYVKRIVGLPGDTITIAGTAVTIGGTVVAECRVGPWGYDATHHGDLWLETLGGKQWLVLHDVAGIHAPPSGTWIVPPGQVFVLGDNRENSSDSRMWGGLPLDAIVGVVADPLALPAGAPALRSGLDRCIAVTSSAR